MIKVEQLHNVLMEYEKQVLWIKYDERSGLEITNLSTQTVLDGQGELDVLASIIRALTLVSVDGVSEIGGEGEE